MGHLEHEHGLLSRGETSSYSSFISQGVVTQVVAESSAPVNDRCRLVDTFCFGERKVEPEA